MLINLTKHTIVIRTERGDVTIPPSGHLAYVVMTNAPIDLMSMPLDRNTELVGVPIVVRAMTGLSFPGELHHADLDNADLLVPSMVLDEAYATNHPLRHRLFAPDTGATAIRNEAGQVVAVTRLVRGRSDY